MPAAADLSFTGTIEEWARQTLALHSTLAVVEIRVSREDTEGADRPDAEDGSSAIPSLVIVCSATAGEVERSTFWNGRYAQNATLKLELRSDSTDAGQPVADVAKLARAMHDQIISGAAVDAFALFAWLQTEDPSAIEEGTDGSRNTHAFSLDLSAILA